MPSPKRRLSFDLAMLTLSSNLNIAIMTARPSSAIGACILDK
jgi:hypothetical protein